MVAARPRKPGPSPAPGPSPRPGPPPKPSRPRRPARSLLLVPLLAAGLSGTAVETASAAGYSSVVASTASATTFAAAIEAICESRLPREAGDTVRLIDRGGPFPYPKDGAIFYNREGLLPQQPRGFYREYTVKTPGSPTRGARRIVAAGSAGHKGMYYTANHYRSFLRIDFGC
ncbi:ribonuclease domain-containing protein [Actinomadura fulvescens]|uniref:Uncharacterized protein n=1 Tax=Actinomadura fulvescens TaxID=46160 RepID=A0ABN3PVG1_9ACTN